MRFWRRRRPSEYVPLADVATEIDQILRALPPPIKEMRPRRPSTRDDDSSQEFSAPPSPPTRQVDPHLWLILQQLLLDGALTSYANDLDGRIKGLAAEIWDQGSSAEFVCTQQIQGDRVVHAVSSKVLLSRSQFKALIRAAQSISKRSNGTFVDKGGAPPKYDAEAFLTEAFCILYESNPHPNTPAELRGLALDAYAKAGHPGGTPSEAWARPKISKLWKRLRSV